MQATAPRSVLIVEDERIVAKDLQQTLIEMGYDAFAIASSADEALVHSSQRCPDLVLMDIRIKGNRDGIETAIMLREQFGVPIVYLTAHADDATVERAKRAEPYGYLMKPVKPAELRSAIEVSLYKHEMERQLRERERWFSTTLRSIGDAVITVDLTGTVTFMNTAAETLTGVPAERGVGRPVRDIVRLVAPTCPPSPLDHVLAERRNLVIEEAELVSPASGSRIISDSASLVVDDGDPLGAVMVFRDVTDQKLVQKQLELADRLASLGTMAAGLSHEVNSPLSIILGNAAFVLEELRRSATGRPINLDEALSAQEAIEAAAGRICNIMADLQAFAPPARPARAVTEIGRAIEWAVRTTADQLRGRARVAIDDGCGDLTVRLDEARLRQILVHLLSNAAHAIPPGSPDDHCVTVRTRRRDQLVEIEVHDTGSGMTSAVAARIFEPFFTTRTVGQGVGLGLAICHGIATSAGGRIDVESELGKGSMFRVVLPEAVIPPPRTASGAPGRRARILAIDDEPMVLRTFARMLREHEVVCVDDARNAIAMLERGEAFDVIFSDVMMPDMTGMELYEYLLRTNPAAARRIVFISGGAVSARTRDFLAVVANTSLQKPIAARDLRAFVEQALAERSS